MESDHIERWKLFHKEKELIAHSHLIQGTVIAVVVLLSPFLLLWAIAKLFGQ